MELRRQAHGGALQRGNPGNKGGGRKSAEAEALVAELAEQIATDRMVWNVRLAQAQAGDLKSHQFAHEVRFGKPTEKKEITGDVTFRVVYDD